MVPAGRPGVSGLRARRRPGGRHRISPREGFCRDEIPFSEEPHHRVGPQGSRSHSCHKWRRSQLPHPGRTSPPISRGTHPAASPGRTLASALSSPIKAAWTPTLAPRGAAGGGSAGQAPAPGLPLPFRAVKPAGWEGQVRIGPTSSTRAGGCSIPPLAGLTLAGRLRRGCRSPLSPVPPGSCSWPGSGCEQSRIRPQVRRCRGDKVGTSPLHPALSCMPARREREVSDGRILHRRGWMCRGWALLTPVGSSPGRHPGVPCSWGPQLPAPMLALLSTCGRSRERCSAPAAPALPLLRGLCR